MLGVYDPTAEDYVGVTMCLYKPSLKMHANFAQMFLLAETYLATVNLRIIIHLQNWHTSFLAIVHK